MKTEIVRLDYAVQDARCPGLYGTQTWSNYLARLDRALTYWFGK